MKKQRSIYRKSVFDFLLSAIIPVCFTGVIILMVISGLRQTEESVNTEGYRILEESIRRAVVMNYAIEGRYPADIEYIETNYGIFIDRTKYTVHYDIFVSNIMPDIRVIEV